MSQMQLLLPATIGGGGGLYGTPAVTDMLQYKISNYSKLWLIVGKNKSQIFHFALQELYTGISPVQWAQSQEMNFFFFPYFTDKVSKLG